VLEIIIFLLICIFSTKTPYSVVLYYEFTTSHGLIYKPWKVEKLTPNVKKRLYVTIGRAMYPWVRKFYSRYHIFYHTNLYPSLIALLRNKSLENNWENLILAQISMEPHLLYSILASIFLPIPALFVLLRHLWQFRSWVLHWMKYLIAFYNILHVCVSFCVILWIHCSIFIWWQE